mmetsp:Transcript_4765/g.11262  ORF Transcript_4765/g.11262 Transcript_4765/m.11262 type:complete len:650 (+) Transcript_4765:157-2106(+)|eukprot:CAMPEP_0114519722 /NCGR_PEP_ID=MMETSP0109-20121206/19166_1 /TAXON_ID=29199 /ORGANISM="Chlorarachnion reptans, Strain CCCM449" /LENGTH=649 /DNA_ID=CAMNT_0001700503 /DNA_START=108 /DNA_END=2057 /DNA_ORIENTATION=-
MAAEQLAELHKLVTGDNHDDPEALDRIIELTGQFLKGDAKEGEITKCRIVALIMKEKYKEAIALIVKEPNFEKTYAFELLYCHYQLKQNEKAMKIVSNTSDRSKNKGFWHVQAQLFRRLGKCQEAAEIYEKQFISKKARMSGDDATEIRANYTACLAESNATKAVKFSESLEQKLWSFALAHNLAASFVEVGRLTRAAEVAKQAEELCKKEIEEEGGDEKEVEAELEGIRMMQAYVHQKEGKAEEAEKLYKDLLGSSDSVIAACARINLIHLKQGETDSCQDWARAIGNAPFSKLSKVQKSAAQLNHCLVLMKGKRAKEQKQTFEQLKRKFPKSEYPALCYASALFKDGGKDGPSRAGEILSEWLSDHPPATECRIALATLHLTQRNIPSALQALQNLGSELTHQPAVVGTCVRLLRKTGKLEEAGKCLDAAIAFWKEESKDANSDEVASELRAASAELKARLGDYKAAAEAYEHLAKATGEVPHLCGVVANAASFDLTMAEKYAKKLPQLEELEELDLDALEALGATSTSQMDVEGAAEGKEQKTKKKKRKRKKRLPKDYDPNETPDPERWLPKWERSYNKRSRGSRRRNKNQMRGPQGGKINADLVASLDKSKPEEDKDEGKKPPVAPKAQKLSSRERRRMKKKKRR